MADYLDDFFGTGLTPYTPGDDTFGDPGDEARPSAPIIRQGGPNDLLAAYIKGPAYRPLVPGKTVYRIPKHFSIQKGGRASAGFQTQRGSSHIKRGGFSIGLHSSLVAKILATIDPIYKSKNGFYLTLTFEIMEDGQPHPQPCLGIPLLGLYKHGASGLHSLGLRVEWRLAGLKHICSAPIPLFTGLVVQMNKELVRPGGEAGVPSAERMFQEMYALINMLRCQTFSNPGPGTGFDLAIYPGTRPPLFKVLRVDHLSQTLDFEVLERTMVPVPEKATFEENAAKLLSTALAGRLTPFTVMTYPAGGTKDAISIDDTSARAVSKTGVMCDTCCLVKLLIPNMPPFQCSASPDSDTCQACTRLCRPCTFTPQTALVAGWTGDRSHGPISHLEISKGPMRLLVFHRTVSPKCSLDGTLTLRVPEGWDTLVAFFDGADEEQEEQEDDEDGEDDEDDEDGENGEDDEDGEEDENEE